MDDFEKDVALLVRDKYEGNASQVTSEDTERLAAGEPLAYVIGWIPFLGLTIWLDSHPLIPRPETEWWTELLIAHLREKFGDAPFTLLDLCAGSGAIGLAVLAAFPNAHVYFSEIIPEYFALIAKNIDASELDATRATIVESDLFESFAKDLAGMKFDVIATNPPYIPETRELEASVKSFEPSEALFAGADGLSLISRIAREARTYLLPGGEVWMECDIDNAEAARAQFADPSLGGALRTEVRTDLYGRPRLVVAWF